MERPFGFLFTYEMVFFFVTAFRYRRNHIAPGRITYPVSIATRRKLIPGIGPAAQFWADGRQEPLDDPAMLDSEPSGSVSRIRVIAGFGDERWACPILPGFKDGWLDS